MVVGGWWYRAAASLNQLVGQLVYNAVEFAGVLTLTGFVGIQTSHGVAFPLAGLGNAWESSSPSLDQHQLRGYFLNGER
jgi:hypothetical protein